MDLKHEIARRLLRESYLLRNVTEQLREQLEVTLKNFHSFFSQRQLQKTSIFGTNIVENFFQSFEPRLGTTAQFVSLSLLQLGIRTSSSMGVCIQEPGLSW